MLCIVFRFVFCFFFFFFKQKTAYEVRISDWSSDVCSSDLAMAELVVGMILALARKLTEQDRRIRAGEWSFRLGLGGFELRGRDVAKIGRASCRERVCQYV